MDYKTFRFAISRLAAGIHIKNMVLAFCIALLVVIWGGVGALLQYERELAINATMQANSNLAGIFEEHVLRIIKIAELTLRQMEAEYKRHGTRFDLAGYEKDHDIAAGSYNLFSIINESGDLILAGQPYPKPQNYKGRENYQFHVKRNTPELFISKPRLAVTNGKWSIFVSRRISKADGSFGGLSALAIDPLYFSNFYRKINLGKDGVVALVGRDGVIRAREADNKSAAGQDIKSSEAFAGRLLKSDHGSFIAVSAVDHVSRIMSYRALRDYPLIVAVGTSEAAALSNFSQRQTIYLSWAGGASAVILFFAALVMTQLSRQERIGRRLQESEKRFRGLTDLSADWYWEQDTEYRFTLSTYLKGDSETWVGGKSAGRKRWELPYIDVSEKQWQAHKATLDARRPFHGFELKHLSANGEVEFVSIAGQPMFDASGRFIGYQGIGHDITERKRAETQLRLAASVFDSAAEGIMITDKDNAIISVNHTFTEITGYSAQEAIGRNPRLLSSGRQAAAFYAEMWASINGTGRWQGEIWDQRKNGEPYCERLSITAIRNEKGGITHHCAIFMDITGQKMAEAELMDLNAGLENRVAQRTAELERTNKELEAFSYSISHDLRAPLRAVNGFSKIVLKENNDKLDKISVSYLQRIHAGAEHMAVLIDDLLALSRVSRQEMRWQDVDLTALAHQVVGALVETYPERNVRITVQPDLSGRGDPGLLRIVLENLIGNAWKFTARAGEARIEVGGNKHHGETVYFAQDNGAGFDMRYASKLFVPFQRLHGSKEFEGTGIGLSIVERIVAKHGGRVWAEGKPGQGATFHFTLGSPAGFAQNSRSFMPST